MKVYMCDIWDGIKQAWICIGIFSSKASAQSAGADYLSENAQGALRVCDWEEVFTVSKCWYSDTMGHSFTRLVTECEIDERLA